MEHPGDVFYAVGVRAFIGFPVYTIDGEKNKDDPRQDIFLNDKEKRELAIIPGAHPPIWYHTLVVEAGEKKAGYKLERHREFVIMHSDRLLEEFIIAYKRVFPNRGAAPASSVSISSGADMPPLVKMVEEFKKQLGCEGNMTEVVSSACQMLGVDPKAGGVKEQAIMC